MNVITKVEVQKRNKNRVNIYIDEEFAFSCSTEIVYQNKLNSGEKVDETALRLIVDEDNYLKCKETALRIIEKNYKSEKEIKDKLISKGYSESTINRAINFLKEYNFLDDSKYVDMYIKERIKNDGIKKIRFALSRKGIQEEIIKKKIEDIDRESFESSAFELCKKKYEILLKSENDKRKLIKKLSEYLARRGYSWEEIRSVVIKVTNDSIDE